MQSQFNNLLQKQMDRKEFLKIVGAGVVAISGAGTIVKMFDSGIKTKQQTVGYGASVYGGNKVSRPRS